MNAPVKLRSVPNDLLYDNQARNLERSGFPDAWNHTTGGHTVNGDEIVIALLDDGFDVEHEDLRTSLWQNPGEIAGDGIDNDGNGKIDDVNGWDFVGNDGDFPELTHGTQVLGLLGASGNNRRGITGLNWASSVMLLRSVETIAQTIEAYEYVRRTRELWNESGGRQGAFVVATNASFGIEGATCSDYPVWGEMYDELGKVGILTAAATANRSWDVDRNGDVPTDCTSDYLITVANADVTDGLFRSSAYGRQSIDLAAPGEGSYSTFTGSRYGSFGSTSAAAPYVTGAIALLYASDCGTLLEVARRDPAEAARYIRSVILSGARRVAALDFRVATGGIIDVAASQRQLLDQCSALARSEFSVVAVSPNPAGRRLRVVTDILGTGSAVQTSIFDVLGREVAPARVLTVRTTPLTLDVELPHLASGPYFLTITQNGRVATATFLVGG